MLLTSCFLQVLFGSTPTFPTIDRVWQVIDRYRVHFCVLTCFVLHTRCTLQVGDQLNIQASDQLNVQASRHVDICDCL